MKKALVGAVVFLAFALASWVGFAQQSLPVPPAPPTVKWITTHMATQTMEQGFRETVDGGRTIREIVGFVVYDTDGSNIKVTVQVPPNPRKNIKGEVDNDVCAGKKTVEAARNCVEKTIAGK